MENKLTKNVKLSEEYAAFLNEYEALGHMTLVNPEQDQADLIYYLPHHAVIKNVDDITVYPPKK